MEQIGARLRQARKRMKLSLRELAERAAVSASLLSQIENGKVNPSVETLYSISDALKLPASELLAETPRTSETFSGDGAPTLTASELRLARVNGAANTADLAAARPLQESCPIVTHPGSRPTITLTGGVTWARLTCRAEANAEFLEVTYEPGGSSGAHMSHHNGREFGLVLEGVLTLELAFDCFTLHPGDSIVFDSTTPHRLSNQSEQPMKAIWVVLNR
jgi:transcriptional regulator with XRE-family HTH domain/quercetin dioxygenase-like cupin family protein